MYYGENFPVPATNTLQHVAPLTERVALLEKQLAELTTRFERNYGALLNDVRVVASNVGVPLPSDGPSASGSADPIPRKVSNLV